MQRLCAIYRCAKKEGMYLYVDKQKGLDAVPDNVQQATGKTELAMALLLTEDKKLARANARDVLEAIESQGFYLQIPPTIADLQSDHAMQDIREKNTKL